MHDFANLVTFNWWKFSAIIRSNSQPTMQALCPMLLGTYYAKNYAIYHNQPGFTTCTLSILLAEKVAAKCFSVYIIFLVYCTKFIHNLDTVMDKTTQEKTFVVFTDFQ